MLAKEHKIFLCQLFLAKTFVARISFIVRDITARIISISFVYHTNNMSKVYSFKRIQLLRCDVEKAWAFFSDPANLAELTPADLKFQVLSEPAHEMYAGQLIEYYVHPVLNIPLYWMTEITHVEQNKFFVDEQRFGPYSFWHHQHHFKEVPGGTEMTDIIHYKLPLWFFGDIANTLFVKNKLKDIFDYRFLQGEKVIGN